MKFKTLGVFGLLLSLSSCASLVEGTNQTVMFQVLPDTAVCNVRQKGKFIGTLQNGGGQLDVPKSRKDIKVDCTAPGYEKQTLDLVSSASGWGVAGCLLDFCITDHATGAFNKYDDSVTIALSAANRVPAAASRITGPSTARAAAPRAAAPTANRAVAVPAVARTNSQITPPIGPTPVAATRVQTWQTVHSQIRAYWGPNVERDFFDMPNSVPLSLVSKQGQWGLFAYRANNGKNGKVWIALDSVQAAR